MNGSRRMDLPCLITTNTLHHSCLYFLCVLRVTVDIHGSGFGMQSSSWYFMRHWLEVWLESVWGVGGKSCFRYNHYPWRELCLWLKSHYQWGVNMKSLLFCFRNLWKINGELLLSFTATEYFTDRPFGIWLAVALLPAR